MQVSDEIIKVLEYLGEKLGVTIDWTSNNVLPYVEQLCEKFVHWEISTSYAWIAIMGVATILSLIFAIIVYKVDDGWYGVEWMMFGITLLIAIIVCGDQIFDIIECKTFPEKAIYDYIQLHFNNSSR
jgi:hypothetical protein